LASLSQSLAVELAPQSIHVNYICPGFIRTEMTRKYLDRWLFRQYIEHQTPLGRFGEPAKAALFLASPDSEFHHRRRDRGGRRTEPASVLIEQ